MALGCFVQILVRLAFEFGHCQARNCGGMASQRLSPLLDLEEPSANRSTEDQHGGARANQKMSRENPLWGAPRIHGELLKLGIDISQATVAKYRVRNPRPPSQSWRTFLDNHVSQLASIDFFTVPTIWFEVLFVFVVLAHDRRRVIHFNVTAHPTAVWTAQQILEAFPFETAPKYLLRDRDAIYGFVLRQQIEAMSITEVLGAPRSPWQRAYVERIIGSIRRDCLDHVIVFDESSLRRILRRYLDYYHDSRTHLSLDKDAPTPRPVQPAGRIVAIPQLGGLHHRYERRAA